MSVFDNPEELHHRSMCNLHHEMMRGIDWEHKKTNGMTNRLLTRAETNAFEHCMLDMYQILDTLVRTDEISQQKINLKELNYNISHMSKMEFQMMKHHSGLRKLAADNLKHAYAFAYELQNILDKTEKEEDDFSLMPGSQERDNSRFRWNNGLLHRELADVIHKISNLLDVLLPGYLG